MKSYLPLRTLILLGFVGCSGAESAERSETAGGAVSHEAGLPDSAGLALESKLPGRFGQISNVVELDRDRVAFADTRNKLFLTASFGGGTLDTLGNHVDAIAKDAGPADYKFPGWVARLAGDTTDDLGPIT